MSFEIYRITKKLEIAQQGILRCLKMMGVYPDEIEPVTTHKYYLTIDNNAHITFSPDGNIYVSMKKPNSFCLL